MRLIIVILVIGYFVYHMVILPWIREWKDRKWEKNFRDRMERESKMKPRPWLHEKMSESASCSPNFYPASGTLSTERDWKDILREMRDSGIKIDSTGRSIDFSSLEE
jgi:hypothetical protein